MKTINKVMTNDEIYRCAIGIMNALSNIETPMPAAISFSITKNKKTISALAEDIEKYRIDILNRYGAKIVENNIVSIPEEKVNDANKELEELLTISQEVRIYTFSIEDLQNVNLSPAQMEAILFMIDEE